MGMTSKKANHARRMNGLIGTMQERWAARVLKMQINPGNGIDLVDPIRNLGVEVKGITPLSSAWTVQNHQLSYANGGMDCYWFLGTYNFKEPIERIRTRDLDEIEDMVAWRDFRLISWDWVRQFRRSHTSGSSSGVEWEYTFRYARLNALPGTYKIYDVENGRVRLTAGVPRNLFHEDIISDALF